MDSDLQQERLKVHRELQLLRAASWRPKRGQGKQKTAWVKERVRKLDQLDRPKKP